ncbi:MAG: hypothetical protein U9P42_00530 [Candidatus Fermentibacteria bacterium]|nr:hypothetical protein [Candidatus Fermentibacteria bacterium]
MKKLLVVLAFVLLAGCGGSKIQLNNGTGLDLAVLTMTIHGNSETWYNVKADQTVGSDMEIPPGASPILLEWETAGEQLSMEYVTIDSANSAERVSILFAADEMSVNYAF